jgi:hypothetical protein
VQAGETLYLTERQQRTRRPPPGLYMPLRSPAKAPFDPSRTIPGKRCDELRRLYQFQHTEVLYLSYDYECLNVPGNSLNTHKTKSLLNPIFFYLFKCLTFGLRHKSPDKDQQANAKNAVNPKRKATMKFLDQPRILIHHRERL